MSAIRNASARGSVGTSNGSRPARNNNYRKRPSAEEVEMSRQEARIEELQERVRSLETELERVSWLFDAVPVGYVLMDEHGNARELNAQLEKMLGFKRGFLAPGSLSRLILPPDLPI